MGTSGLWVWYLQTSSFGSDDRVWCYFDRPAGQPLDSNGKWRDEGFAREEEQKRRKTSDMESSTDTFVPPSIPLLLLNSVRVRVDESEMRSRRGSTYIEEWLRREINEELFIHRWKLMSI